MSPQGFGAAAVVTRQEACSSAAVVRQHQLHVVTTLEYIDNEKSP